MLTDGNDFATPTMITKENDNQIVEMLTTVEPMVVSEPTAEDSGIQTANESPPSEGHSDSVDVIQSDDSAKNGKIESKYLNDIFALNFRFSCFLFLTDQDISSAVFDIAKSTMPPPQQQQATVNEIEPTTTTFEALVAVTVPPPQIPIAENPGLFHSKNYQIFFLNYLSINCLCIF